jgi:predicted nucleic-acid-binding Zn-ribbon protein
MPAMRVEGITCPSCGNDYAVMKDARYTHTYKHIDISVKQFRMECGCGMIWATEYQRERNDQFLRQAEKHAREEFGVWGG